MTVATTANAPSTVRFAELDRHLQLDTLPEPVFVNAPGRLDPNRFSCYCRVGDQAMLPTVKQAGMPAASM